MNDELIDLLAEMCAVFIIERSGLVQDNQCPDEGLSDGLFTDADLGISCGVLSE